MNLRGDHIKSVKRILGIVVMAATGLGMKAQNDVMLNQHWAIPSFYNPAQAGNTDYLRIRAAGRMQWIGIENAPMSFLGAADSPIKVGTKKVGLGVTAIQESLGLFQNLNIGFQANYKFKMGKGVFSIGVQPAYYNSKFKGSKVILPDNDDYHQGSDSSIPTQDMTGSKFDLSAGLSFTTNYLSLGVSCMHIMNPKVWLNLQGSSSSDMQEYQTELPRTLYFIADSNIPIKNTLFELQPSLLVMSDFTGVTGEASMRTTYNKFLTFGLAYRWEDAIGITIGAEYKNFFLGYAYEYPLSGINKVSSGSHELVAGYSLKLDFSGQNKHRHRSIRIM